MLERSNNDDIIENVNSKSAKVKILKILSYY